MLSSSAVLHGAIGRLWFGSILSSVSDSLRSCSKHITTRTYFCITACCYRT